MQKEILKDQIKRGLKSLKEVEERLDRDGETPEHRIVLATLTALLDRKITKLTGG